MQSTSPCIIRHFIPLHFSKEAVDMPSSPLPRPFVPKEDNPLQNIKLKALEKASNPEFTLTFANKTHKDYRPKHTLQFKQLLQTIKQEQNKINIMLAVTKSTKDRRQKSITYRQRKDYSPQTQENRRLSAKRSPAIVSPAPREEEIEEGKIMRSKTCQQIRGQGFTQRQEARTRSRASARNIASSSSGRWWRMGPGREESRQGRISQTRNSLRIRGSKAPDSEVVDHLRRNSLKDIRRSWED